MADVTALFANRKKTKGKKKVKNFNAVLEEQALLEAADAARKVVVDYDSDGNEVLQKVPVVGGLTAAVNANRIREKESRKAKLMEEDGGAGPTEASTTLKPQVELINGEWVDDDQEQGPANRPLMSKTAGKVADLESMTISDGAESQPSEDVEMNKKLFHWARQQSIQQKKGAPEAKPVEEEDPHARKIYRPRHLVEAKNRQSGLSALKELDNDAVFPTLGGHKTALKNVAKGAWGTVEDEIIRDFTVKQESGEYLGSEFIAAENFDGAKPGYCFTKGPQGLGYYWESTPVATAGDLGNDTAVEKQDSAPPGVESPPTPPVQKEPVAQPAKAPEPSAEELERLEKKRLERERKKQEKKKEKLEWERQVALAKQREEERAEQNKVAEPAPAPATSELPPPDRFAGLKKKKKKKKAAEEEQ